jgi:hypothetical protein
MRFVLIRDKVPIHNLDIKWRIERRQVVQGKPQHGCLIGGMQMELVDDVRLLGLDSVFRRFVIS